MDTKEDACIPVHQHVDAVRTNTLMHQHMDVSTRRRVHVWISRLLRTSICVAIGSETAVVPALPRQAVASYREVLWLEQVPQRTHPLKQPSPEKPDSLSAKTAARFSQRLCQHLVEWRPFESSPWSRCNRMRFYLDKQQL